MKPILVAALLGCTALSLSTARANDSAFTAVGGSMKPMKGQHSSVRMESEKIVVDAYANRYDTTVDFIFHNTGRRNIATMGFPESNYGDVADARKKTTFLKFETSVDGVPFKAVRQSTSDNSVQEYDTYWVKTVPFAAGQRRRVRVRYSSPYGGTAMLGFSRAITYAFTGGNWKSNVKRTDMEVRVHTPGRWLMMTLFTRGDKPSVPLHWPRSGNTFKQSWTNWEAQGDILVGLVRSREGWLTSKSMATDKSMQWSGAIQKANEFTVGNAGNGKLEPFEGFTVDGFAQKGVTFINLSVLKDALDISEQDKAEGIQSNDVIKTLWDAKTRTRTLIAGKRKFAWREGVKSWTADGKTLPLPAAPFVVNQAFYLPAAPVVNALGGKLTSNAAQHWIAVSVPPVK